VDTHGRGPYRLARRTGLALALALGLAGCDGLVPRTRAGVVSTVGEIRRLPAPLTAMVDVKLTGTVTFFNNALDQAWIRDATGGVRVDRIGLDPLRTMPAASTNRYWCRPATTSAAVIRIGGGGVPDETTRSVSRRMIGAGPPMVARPVSATVSPTC
jgi:hypothetical protein